VTRAFTQNQHREPADASRWLPIGSYDTYQEAQRAVDHLADQEFPVQGITIVGIEPMVVERVDGRLTWSRVLGPARPPEGGSACSSACC